MTQANARLCEAPHHQGRVLLSGPGGTLVLPDPLLLDRADGGHLVVNPPREVWERSQLTATELAAWSALVAAAGRAMIDTLPQLDGGCVNYWEAGNWALHERALPAGPKRAADHRRVHLHLLGRSRHARHESWTWGEAPAFPRFDARREWAAPFQPLTAAECQAVATAAAKRLHRHYGMTVTTGATCAACGYPHP